jgi:hypothetical protein
MFYDPYKTPSSEIGLVVKSDASGWGAGAVFGAEWWYFAWTPEEVVRFDISYRELYALSVAACTWCENLRARSRDGSARIMLFMCDNAAAVEATNGGSVWDEDLMYLVRKLHFLSAENNFYIICKHLAGVNNSLADSLSRGQVGKFRKEHPQAAEEPVNPIRWDHPSGRKRRWLPETPNLS